jgi:adenosylhomocysteine nucleosidase
MPPSPDLSPVDVCVLAALPQELAPLDAHTASRSSRAGLEFTSGELAGLTFRSVVAGVGKVAAARAATLLLDTRPRLGLLVVGVCGGLALDQRIGALVHATAAVQCDLYLPRRGAESADQALANTWREIVPGPSAVYMTADRAAIMPWRRWLRRRRSTGGPAVADMETAAAAWVARSCGVPWAALRAISDTQGPFASRSFARHFHEQAPRAAATLPSLFAHLAKRPSSPPSP